jgi:hypothetical protein
LCHSARRRVAERDGLGDPRPKRASSICATQRPGFGRPNSAGWQPPARKPRRSGGGSIAAEGARATRHRRAGGSSDSRSMGSAQTAMTRRAATFIRGNYACPTPHQYGEAPIEPACVHDKERPHYERVVTVTDRFDPGRRIADGHDDIDPGRRPGRAVRRRIRKICRAGLT